MGIMPFYQNEVVTVMELSNEMLDMRIPMSVVLSRKAMLLWQVVNLKPGDVILLDKKHGDDMDVFVNDEQIAQGRVVAVDGRYGVKITEIKASVGEKQSS
jgi:flagellar motor switch protein FliN/FliY